MQNTRARRLILANQHLVFIPLLEVAGYSIMKLNRRTIAFLTLCRVFLQGFQGYFPDTFLPNMQPVSTLMQHHEVSVGEPYRPQEDMNSLILNIKTEPDLLDIHSFVYGGEHDDSSTSENRCGCESEQEGEYVKKEASEEQLRFCGELESNCKAESIEISIEEEEECEPLLEEHEEVNVTGTLEESGNCCEFIFFRCSLLLQNAS